MSQSPAERIPPTPPSGGAGGTASFALLRPHRSAPSFSLTPLADVMFQLLLFFMLTSSLAPYALLQLGTPAGSAASPGSRAASVPDSAGTVAETQVIWHLGRDEIRSGQTRIALDLLPQALDALQAEGLRDLVVIVTQTAQTADIARLLESVQQTNFARLQLIGG